MTSQKITVLGAGRWGTAVASLLAQNGHQVTLWCFEPEVAYDINHTHINRQYFPEFTLNHNITACTDLAQAIDQVTYLVEAIPVAFLRSLVKQTKARLSSTTPWIILSKGIEEETLHLPTQIIQDELGKETPVVVFGGPTFAHELMQQQFSAASIASTDASLAHGIIKLLNKNYFVGELSLDPIGVQVGGAVKNVIAIMIGLANGAGHRDNTTAYLLTQALNEMATLIQSMGGSRETVYGLSGLGDMILTCTGSLSKNLKAGRLIAQGRNLDELKEVFGTLPEGINTVKSVQALTKKYNVSLPLCEKTYNIMFNKQKIETLFQ